MSNETKSHYDGDLLDITGADTVEVQLRSDRKVLWVNVDGVCRLRICRIRGAVSGEIRTKDKE